MKITKIDIKNYAGIVAMSADVPEHGIIFQGGNGRGKSSALNALKAALEGKGIGVDVVHNGADAAEVRVELVSDANVAHTVRRRISSKGANTVEVCIGDMAANKPAAFLAKLLGATLDPLELATVDPKKRRALVLAALPVTVTQEQLASWVPGIGAVDVSGHGLEVVERLRKAYYDKRTDANRALKVAAAEHARLKAEAAELAGGATAGAVPVDDAERDLEAARLLVTRLDAQNVEAEKASARGADARKRIDQLNEEAAHLAKNAQATRPASSDVIAARHQVDDAKAFVATKERELADAKAAHLGACDALAGLENASKAADEDDKLAADRRRIAAELATTIGAVAIAAVPADELTAAFAALDAAVSALAASKASKASADAGARATAAEAALAAAKGTADELDGVVERLTTTAPQALVDGAAGIPGLSMVDDDIALDGVRWAGLSTSEQMRLCLDVARRVSESSIFFVDRLESIDEERRETFVRLATADGGQLFGTLVTKGDVQLVAVEPGELAAAAE